MTTAAVALSNGWADPLEFLALPPGDYAIAVAVVQRAEELRAERDKHYADYTAAKTGGAILPGLAKTIKRMIQALRG